MKAEFGFDGLYGAEGLCCRSQPLPVACASFVACISVQILPPFEAAARKRSLFLMPAVLSVVTIDDGLGIAFTMIAGAIP